MSKYIIITGASSGIGEALYKHFKKVRPTSNVFGVSRRGPDIKTDFSQKNYTFPITAIPDHSVELLINCAGIMPLDERDCEKQIFDVNFWSVVNIIQRLQSFKKFANPSCIINIASISAMKADSFLPIYAASKAALLSLTQSLAVQMAPTIRVNAISPGFYNTNLVQGPTPEELIEQIPLKYEENPEELGQVAEMIFHTKYLTGANIVVDGGCIIC